MSQAIIEQSNEKMNKAVSNYQVELSKIRTGRASPNLLDNIKVDYYGNLTSISQMASVSCPDARMIVIQPWDQGSLDLIDKAIQKSDLGLVPQNDGKIIRLPIPALTEERRKEFSKHVGKLAEEARIAIRNIRRGAMDDLKKAEKDKTISEDESKKSQEKIQQITDGHIKKIDEISGKKSKELLEV